MEGREGPSWDVMAGRRAPRRVVRRGRDIAVFAGELRDSRDRLVATATASAIIRRGHA